MPRDGQQSTKQEPQGNSSGDAVEGSPVSRKLIAAPWVRLTGSGLELAMTTILLGGIGMAIDNWVQTTRPVFAAMAGLSGFSLGMYRFIRIALSVSAAQRDVDAEGISRAMEIERSKNEDLGPQEQQSKIEN